MALSLAGPAVTAETPDGGPSDSGLSDAGLDAGVRPHAVHHAPDGGSPGLADGGAPGRLEGARRGQLDGGVADAGTSHTDAAHHPAAVAGAPGAHPGHPVGAVPGTPPGKGPPPAKPVPPKPLTDEEKAVAFEKKHQYEQACPLLEKSVKATPASAPLWAEWSQCEERRGHKKVAIEAASHAATAGDKAVRQSAYQTLHDAGAKVDLPPKGCEWLPETPGGVCDQQMWACGYDWETPSATATAGGHAVTFGVADDERDALESALREGTALRPQLAAEWKALVNQRSDALVCASCHQRAVDSADGLVNARAVACFQQKTGRNQPPELCSQQDADCDIFTACLDEASSLARRSEDDKTRTLWPEAADIIVAAHKVCDATCGVVGTTRCDVVSVDACRGLVGYSCVQTQRGRRPMIRYGELSINDGSLNWSEPAPQN